jgi:hypothetical protein
MLLMLLRLLLSMHASVAATGAVAGLIGAVRAGLLGRVLAAAVRLCLLGLLGAWHVKNVCQLLLVWWQIL